MVKGSQLLLQPLEFSFRSLMKNLFKEAHFVLRVESEGQGWVLITSFVEQLMVTVYKLPYFRFDYGANSAI